MVFQYKHSVLEGDHLPSLSLHIQTFERYLTHVYQV